MSGFVLDPAALRDHAGRMDLLAADAAAARRVAARVRADPAAFGRFGESLLCGAMGLLEAAGEGACAAVATSLRGGAAGVRGVAGAVETADALAAERFARLRESLGGIGGAPGLRIGPVAGAASSE